MESFHRLVQKLSVEAEPGLTTAQLMLINDDLKPVEPARRKWGAWNFVAFWISDAFNINTWMISSSMVVAGLTWWQSWICVWLGYLLAGGFLCLTGRIGATYHIGFPVVSRSSFGIWGSLWPVLNRAVMACIWYGVQSYIGGQCVYLMLRAVWTGWDRDTFPNGFAPDAGTTTADYASFVLFWLLSLPALWFPVHQIRHLFTVKAVVVPAAALAFFVWTLVRAGGGGPVFGQPATLAGSDLAWTMVRATMNCVANFATLIVNDPDFARFAARPRDALLPQLLTIPCSFALTSLVGIVVSSAAVVLYGGAPVWNPLDLLAAYVAEGGAAQRAGVFVIAAAFALAQLGTNVAANSVSAGTDLAALLPRFLNIRRGGYLCALAGLVLCPYQLLRSSSHFTTYLSAYSVFLSSIAGVMVADYYAVRGGYLDVRALYDARRTGPYFFSYGFHWRAYAAYLAGILVNLVGFAGAIGHEVPPTAMYLYNLDFFCGFIVSFGIYRLLCRVSPVPACSDDGRWAEQDASDGDALDDLHLAYDASAGASASGPRVDSCAEDGKAGRVVTAEEMV